MFIPVLEDNTIQVIAMKTQVWRLGSSGAFVRVCFEVNRRESLIRE